MNRSLHAPLLAVTLVIACWSCGRIIEEEEPRELVEYRIEPCRMWCTPMMSPECGGRPEDLAYSSADDCIEECAAVDQTAAWDWHRQEDGTDECLEEWTAVAECMDALTCDEQRAYFRGVGTSTDYSCSTEIRAKRSCYYDSLERGDD